MATKEHASPSEFRRCNRCGRERRISMTRGPTPLCGDCKDVTRDLNEQHLWDDESPLTKAMRKTLAMERQQRAV